MPALKRVEVKGFKSICNADVELRQLDILIGANGSGYEKALAGPLVALEIGLSVLRDQCPHFNSWVTLLERLAVE